MTLSIDVKPSTSTVSGISAMKQALEALESWQKTCLDCGRGSEELGRATQPIAALRQAIAEAEKQEPVAWAEITKEYVAVCNESFENAIPLYTKREWVGLTDEEVMLVMDDVLEGGGWLDVARAIEAKLKEKNS